MSEEIKVGDYVFTKSEICAFLVNEVHEDTVEITTDGGIIPIDKADCKKVYVSDTPPPQTTQTEVEIKGGHMAGYGVDKFSIYDRSIDCVRYDNGLAFNWNDKDEKWTLRYKNHLPHEQEDLKHLFE